MSLLLVSLAISGFGIIVSHNLREFFGPIKRPFGCAKCLTFWGSLFYFVLTGHWEVVGISYVTVICIEKFIWN